MEENPRARCATGLRPPSHNLRAALRRAGAQTPEVLGGQQVPIMSQFGLAGVIELVGGLMMRRVYRQPGGFVASGEMAVAWAHAPRDSGQCRTAVSSAVLYCFVFL